jgi:signal transduction histidine kinase
MKRTGAAAIGLAAILAVALGTLTYAVVDANSSSRHQLQRAFDQRAPIAAALFTSLLQGGIASPVTSTVRGRTVSAADLQALGQEGEQRLAIYTATGRLLIAQQFTASAPAPSVTRERPAVMQAVAEGTAISNILGSRPNASLELDVRYRTPFGERVEVTEFALGEISSLLPVYMSTLAVPGGQAFIVDGAERVIASNLRRVAPGTHVSDAALLRAAAGSPTGAYELGDVPTHFTSALIPGTQWRVMLSVPDTTLFAAVSGTREWLPWMLLAIAGLTGAAVLLLVVRARRDSRRLASAYGDLELRNAEVEEANKAKSTFLAGMSHELRTPLNAIIGFAELMHDGKVGDVSDRQREFLGDILNSGQHLLTLINDVLDISRVEAGRLEFHPERVEAEPLVAQVATALRRSAEEKRIELTTDIDPDVETVWLDPARFRQVLFNYGSNAVKFTPEGGQVAIRLRRDGEDMLRLEVQDTGIGIAADDIDRLFSEFGQLHPGDAAARGAGLGLALTRGIVEAQGGCVAVHSVIGEGSVFTAVIPCGTPPVSGPSAIKEPAVPAMGR